MRLKQICMALALLPLHAMAEITAGATGTVIVEVSGVSSAEGVVLASLYIAKEGFPDELADAFIGQQLDASESEHRFLFESVPAGPIAISVLHDENLDGRLSMNWMGMPRGVWVF